jgi:signal transduction histidine kinase
MIQRTAHIFHSASSVSFFASVRFRLTLWYLATIAFIVLIQAWNLYSLQTQLAANAVNSQTETQLYQDAQSFTNTYKQMLLTGQSPTTQQVKLSTREILALLRPDGSILDAHGPLTATTIRQLQTRASSQVPFNLTLSQTQTQRNWWWSPTNDYRFVSAPILNKDTRIAILMIGLPRENWSLPPSFWIVHGVLFLLISLIGGYWLASKTMRPVQMITRMAREINATDLRRRLHLKRRDEFGELAATFDQMLARLEAAFKRQTQFTADASHELRTPLTIMNLEINRALTQLQTPEEYRQVLEQMQGENEQMAGIVNSLLLLARADTGQIVLRQEEVDLSDIALASVERLLPLARQSRQENYRRSSSLAILTTSVKCS